MLKATGVEGVELVRKLAEAVFSNSIIAVGWKESYILNLYKGKGEFLDRAKYHGLKLTDLAMKLLEWVSDSSVRQVVTIDEMQFALVPGRAILIVCQL